MNQTKYIVIRDYPEMGFTKGEYVYHCIKPNYGCVSDDERMTGQSCVAITRDPTGDYPFKVVPSDLIRIATVDAQSIKTAAINTITTDVTKPVVPASHMYQLFQATAISHYYNGNEHPVPAILSSDRGQPAIRVTTDHDHIYITKQQAMDFFGLVDSFSQAGNTYGKAPEPTPYERITGVSLERISELAKVAGHKPIPEANAMDMVTNSIAEVMFTRFAYLIAKELTKE